MSEVTRATALHSAIQHATAGGAHVGIELVLQNALKIDAFLNGSAAPAVVPTGTKAKPAPEAAVKPGKSKTPSKSEEQIVAEALAHAAKETANRDAAEEAALMVAEEDSEEPVVTLKMVKEALGKLLSADLRTEAKGLLAKYEATSLGSLPQKSYGAFLAEANELIG